MMLDYCQPLPRLRSTVAVPLNSELLLPLLPLDDRVILPHMTVPVAVNSESARAAVLAARQTDGLVVLVPHRRPVRSRWHRRSHRRIWPDCLMDGRRQYFGASTAPS